MEQDFLFNDEVFLHLIIPSTLAHATLAAGMAAI